MSNSTSREFAESYSQWYWSDYLADERVSLSSLAAQGLWIRMLGYMFASPHRGYLYLADKPVTKQNASKLLAKLCGSDEQTVSKLLDELEVNGVFSICEHQTIYNRRMVRDADISRKRAEAGSKGGKASKHKAKPEQSSKQTLVNQTPDSRLQTPKSETQNPEELTNSRTPPERTPAKRHLITDILTQEQRKRFDRFWTAYPKKKSKGDAEKAWKVINPSEELVDIILKAIERLKPSEQWTKEGGRFIPYPATWLRAKGWEDIPETEALPEVKTGKNEYHEYNRTPSEPKWKSGV
jgi:hypothetical protein